MTLSNAKRIGNVIRSLRKAKGLTQEDMASRMNTAFSFVGRIERGQTNLTLESLEKAAAALDTTFFQLMTYAAQEDDDLIYDDLAYEIAGMIREQDQQTKEKMLVIIRNILELNNPGEKRTEL